MPPTITAPTATAHPILIEVIETRLAWVEADTPQHAADLASAYASAPGRMNLPLVDASAETTVVTTDLADWLDADPDQVARLDAYFATRAAE